MLLGKLSYINSLYFVISHYGDSIKDHLLTECREIRWFLKEELKSKRTIGTDEFNQKYWDARYRFEQLLDFIPMIEKLGLCFTDDELSQISGDSKQQWYAKNSLVEETVQDNFKSWNRLLNWWNMLDQEAALLAAWFPPYSDDTKTQNYIEICENTLRNIEDRSFHYREYEQEKLAQIEKKRQEEKRKVQEELYISRSVFAALLQNLWTEKKRVEILEKEKEKQEQMEKERCEAEKLELERQNIERKERERKLKEKQEVEQKERERLLKEKQEAERKALVQSLFDCYNTECRKIDSETVAKRRNIESRAQNEIAQAQSQIGEFLKQKNVFTLFRKKRDAELDAKIAVLDRHIEQVKQNLADELAKCEQDAEEKKNSLYDRILDEAEQSHVKNEVAQEIGE